MDADQPASAKQVAYCKDLFRKTKVYYNTLPDAELVREVKARTSYDLDRLTAGQARTVIDRLKRDGNRVRRLWGVRQL